MKNIFRRMWWKKVAASREANVFMLNYLGALETRDAKRPFEEIIKLAQDPQLRAQLEWHFENEQTHGEVFMTCIRQLGEDPYDIWQYIPYRRFELHNTKILPPLLHALMTFYIFEKMGVESLIDYQAFNKNPAIKTCLDTIVKDEQEHARYLLEAIHAFDREYPIVRLVVYYEKEARGIFLYYFYYISRELARRAGTLFFIGIGAMAFFTRYRPHSMK